MSTSVPETALLEGMTAISAVLDPAVRAFNDRQVLEVYADRERAQRKPRELAFLRARGRELGFPVTLVGADELDAMTAGKTHGGFAARCSANDSGAGSLSRCDTPGWLLRPAGGD